MVTYIMHHKVGVKPNLIPCIVIIFIVYIWIIVTISTVYTRYKCACAYTFLATATMYLSTHVTSVELYLFNC